VAIGRAALRIALTHFGAPVPFGDVDARQGELFLSVGVVAAARGADDVDSGFRSGAARHNDVPGDVRDLQRAVGADADGLTALVDRRGAIAAAVTPLIQLADRMRVAGEPLGVHLRPRRRRRQHDRHRRNKAPNRLLHRYPLRTCRLHHSALSIAFSSC
jgi:hypothetical protein